MRDSRCNRGDISFCSNVISTSGLMSEVFSFGCRSMSGNVGSEISKSGMVENMRVAVGIASPSLSVQKLFLLPV